MDPETINLTRDELLDLLRPAALAGPPGLAEKLLAYDRMGRHGFIIGEHALSTDEREFILKARVELQAPTTRDGALSVGRDRP